MNPHDTGLVGGQLAESHAAHLLAAGTIADGYPDPVPADLLPDELAAVICEMQPSVSTCRAVPATAYDELVLRQMGMGQTFLVSSTGYPTSLTL